MANHWQEDELLLTLHLYCRTPFGQLHHLISFDENFRLVLSNKLKAKWTDETVQEYFLKLEGKSLEMPYRFIPDVEALAVHRDKCVSGG